MSKNLIVKLFVCTIMLCCNMSISVVFAAQIEGEVDVENMKAPPRDIKDILRAVDSGKQDLVLQEKAKKVIALPVPSTNDATVLNNYYYRRAQAFTILGNLKESANTLKLLTEKYPATGNMRTEELVEYAVAEVKSGNIIKAIDILKLAQQSVPADKWGWFLTIDRLLIDFYCVIGDFRAAKDTLADLEIFAARMANSKAEFIYKLGAESQLVWSKAMIYLKEGRAVEAERQLKTSIKLHYELAKAAESRATHAIDRESRSAESIFNASAYWSRIASNNYQLSQAFLTQKRLVEAELAAREGINVTIAHFGVDSPDVGRGLIQLSFVVNSQGRSAEAVLLADAALKQLLKSNSDQSSTRVIGARKALATAFVAQNNFIEADKVFNAMVNGIKSDPDTYAKYRFENLDWVMALIEVGKTQEALKMSGDILELDKARLDKDSPILAMSKAFHAAALQAASDLNSANSEFKAAAPILIAEAQNDAENSTSSVMMQKRQNFALNRYLINLSALYKSNPAGGDGFAAEAFQIADVARGSGVQRALTESSARASIKDPQLANLARQEQDLQRRIGTLSGLLTGLLAAPESQQLPGVQAKLKSDIETFKAQRDSIKKEIERKFPEYAELVDPKPASVERTQKLLKLDEVLVAWYFDDRVGYVWAISKDAPVQFAQLPVGKAQIAKEVAQLRKSLDPGVASIEEIPAFDVNLANQLYQQVLAPVESALKGKKVMLVVPHADLGQLPLSVLVTKPTAQPPKSGMPFAGYKSVPFLTKDIAVAQIPSVTALTALRTLPEGNPNRKNFVGFGDPYFSAQQEKQADKQKGTQLATRGIPLALRNAPKTAGVSSAELALLPRLPDTSLEIEEIAKVIGAGPDDIYLHQQASVKQVMSMDLSNRKIVMFSTHGLVPGELNGLNQPALALSSPEVTGDKDDGLLTMDKVIGLKLNADWVVLSACNTASGEGAGSEAVSGLGRAFFFAGTKALLVSNWPVDSVASRQLMTDLFKRQQENKSLQKSEALRQAMLAQIDQGGAKDGSTMKYSYAHPLFWAPFVVVGD